MPPSVLRPQFALAAILLLAAFLRLFEITTVPPPLHFDEAMNGNDAMENIELGRILPFYPQNGGREGLYINIETALIYFFGPQAWMLRLPAAIFGILTVWGIYLLAAELFDTPVGLLAAFFTAASFWHILFSRLGLHAIGAPLFAVWTLYFLIVAIDRARSSRPYLAQAIAGGFLGGLGFYTYIAYRVTPALAVIAAALFLGVSFEAYHSYFDVWAVDPNVPKTFDAASVDIVNRINALPLTAPKYVVPVTPGIADPGYPPPSQTVMFLTQSYTERQRRETNIHYLLREHETEPDGIDFCRKIALQYRDNVFCLLVNRKAAPKF